MAYTPYKDEVAKSCANCGKGFVTRLDKKRFCQDECRKEFQAKVYRGHCPHCGGELYPAAGQ